MPVVHNPGTRRVITLERTASPEVHVPDLCTCSRLIHQHLRGIVEVQVTYALAGKGDGNPTLRVGLIVWDDTDPPGYMNEETQRKRWAAFEAACDAERAALLGESEAAPAQASS